ncbi:MAG: hypothetical protein JNK15_03180 [Planctomycetes bacterium]|nr:hypothetical protein [Planctomycetota bacterium]
MTPTTTVIALSVCSALGLTASAFIPQSPADAIPWKDLAGGGSALLMLVALVVVLRFTQQERAASSVERKDQATARAEELKAAEAARAEERKQRAEESQAQREHVEKITAEFSTTQQRLFADLREDTQLARRELQDLVRERRTTPP